MDWVTYFAGVATGWLVRGTVDSSRGLVVNAVSAVYTAGDITQRWGAMQREFAEDLLAEGKARFERGRVHRDAAPERAAVSEARSNGDLR